ncbi:MAG: Fur family transcriptional regulator [Woeseiaceae bacterium]
MPNDESHAGGFPPGEHDHTGCVERAVQTAERICRERGLRLTAQRRRVLELVWNGHKPVGAYEILAALKDDGRNAAPPTVYRALDFLIEANLVHRLDSLNAFIGCPDPNNPHTGQFLICRHCRSVAELDDQRISDQIVASAAGCGFSATHQTLEVQGVCQSCRT